MGHITDELWAEIVAATAPEPDFRKDLERVVQSYIEQYQEISDPENYHSIKDEIDDLASAAEKLLHLMKNIDMNTESRMLNEINKDTILKTGGWADDYFHNFNFRDYYYNHIRGKSLYIFLGILKSAQEGIKERKGGLTEKRRMQLRRNAIHRIEKSLYAFSGQLFSRGKRGSVMWLHRVIKLFDPYITFDSCDKMLQKWIKERNSDPKLGAEGQKRVYSIFSSAIKASVDEHVSRPRHLKIRRYDRSALI